MNADSGDSAKTIFSERDKRKCKKQRYLSRKIDWKQNIVKKKFAKIYIEIVGKKRY